MVVVARMPTTQLVELNLHAFKTISIWLEDIVLNEGVKSYACVQDSCARLAL